MPAKQTVAVTQRSTVEYFFPGDDPLVTVVTWLRVSFAHVKTYEPALLESDGARVALA